MSVGAYEVPQYHYFLQDGYPSAERPPEWATPLSLDGSYGVTSQDIIAGIAHRAYHSYTDIALDLLNVASAVFLADCRSRRRIGGYNPFGWRRHVALTVPVRRYDAWNSDVESALNATLNFLSGDDWEVRFVHRTDAAPQGQTYLPFDERNSQICLFSEGLDSLAGLVHRLHSTPESRFMAVSAVIQSQCRPKIENAVLELNRLFRNRVTSVPVPLHRSETSARGRDDRYQRTRSFLLLSIAAITALVVERDEVEIYENGVEAFNFPCEEGLLPGQSSRAMHPLFLDYFACLLTALTGRPFRFAEPYLFSTKAMLVNLVADKSLNDLVVNTVSCMHFPIRKKGSPQCGVCLGCTLRRMAISGATGLTDTSKYDRDPMASRPIEWTRLDIQAHRLGAAARSADPVRALINWSGLNRTERNRLLSVSTVIAGIEPSTVSERMIGLFSRHVAEWQSLVGQGTALPAN